MDFGLAVLFIVAFVLYVADLFVGDVSCEVATPVEYEER